ncbi:hypothetical protein R5W24_006411 [Gemmata sp. JC717]|uniref:hypothetical protein n=1 Tax=Gemmata algarum TaxID=2975278 RepID=UPI0021BA7AE2|nr:hypothetical protein [Gemmata algarum]MDY3557223.1 hypothetical protein [Gemmata algarum]
MNVKYNLALVQNAILAPAARAHEPDIQRIIGAAYEDAVASWELRTDQPPCELVLVIRNGDRQAEEPVSYEELRGSSKFDSKLSRMKDSLAHNGVWREAVHALIADARVWSDGIPGASVNDSEVELNEERGGRYTLPALEIKSHGSLMWVRPVAG